MPKCQWCKTENDDKIELVIVGLEPERWKVCGTCANLYANGDFDELTKRIEEANK